MKVTCPPLLLVDDEVFMIEILAETLQTRGFSTVVAGDGGEALAILRTENVKAPWFLLTDVEMPGLDGVCLIEAILKERLPVNWIVVMSALLDFAPPIQKAKALLTGSPIDFAVLEKPFSPQSLASLIGRMIDK
jgi:CheY-like chemotaxis protein